MLFLCSSDRFNITLDDGLLLRGISDKSAVSVYLVRHFVHITHSLVFLRTYCCQPSFMGTFQIAWVTVHIGPTTAGVILDVASLPYTSVRQLPGLFWTWRAGIQETSQARFGLHFGAAQTIMCCHAFVIYNQARPTPRPAFQLLPTPHTRLRIVEESLSGAKKKTFAFRLKSATFCGEFIHRP